jgi:hypothetical protein
MSNFNKKFLILGIILSFLSSNIWAHHSAAGYDIENRISITGEIEKALFRNPHGTLKVKVTMVNGETVKGEFVEWEVETAAANLLRRRGWEFKNVKKGLIVKLVGHPAKDGSNLIYLREIQMPDGTIMGDPEGKDKALD